VPTERLYYKDPYLRTFEATVLSVEALEGEKSAVTLDATAFYPEGGGQPADTGKIRGKDGTLIVEWTEDRGGEIVHIGKIDGVISVGERVTGEIDWDRRYLIMRTHTAAHILMHAVSRLLEHVDIAGSGLSVGSGRLDFAASITRDQLPAIEEEANKIVEMDAEVRVHVFSREEAARLLESYGSHLGPAHGGLSEIRVIEIVGVGADACGGTHVARTSEVGRIRITKRKSKGRGVVRLEFQVTD